VLCGCENLRSTLWRAPDGCVNQSFVYCDKIPGKNNIREEGFVLAHISRAFSLLSSGSVVSGLWQGRMAGLRVYGGAEMLTSGSL
jgi:hypothetical protein